MDKSRSGLSKTHTTSIAPAPALSPATIAATAIAKSIIELIHSPEASPGPLKYYNARDDASLQALAASSVLGVVQGKVDALKHHIAEAQSGVSQVSEKTKAFWAGKLEFWGKVLSVLEAAGKSLDALSDAEKQARVEFLETGRKAWEVDLPKVLLKLSTEMAGPYALGGWPLFRSEPRLRPARRRPVFDCRPAPGGLVHPTCGAEWGGGG